ncbi:uncharacterized protein LOC144019125 [Festucalex cinctus]
MASTLKTTLHSALLVTLVAVQCRPALLAAITCLDAFSTFSALKSITSMLGTATEHLLDDYMSFHGLSGLPSNVPNYTARGSNFSEQLQDIYAHNKLFHLNITTVEGYQIEDWGNPANVAEPLTQVKGSLLNQGNILKHLAQQLYPEVALTTVEPPHQVLNHSWDKKSYGWKVIVGLKNWLEDVSQVLDAARGPCGNNPAEAAVE